MKRIYLFLLMLVAVSANATFVSKDSCVRIAKNFFYERTGLYPPVTKAVPLIKYKYVIKNGKKKQTSYVIGYAAKFAGGGFVCVQRNTYIRPVIGYDPGNDFPEDSLKQGFALFGWVQLIGENTVAAEYLNESHTQEWDRLASRPAPKVKAGTPLVGPLLKTTWNQEPYVNDSCPYSPTYKMNTCTGCDATAPAQIAFYWQWPVQGTGSYSYVSGVYGKQAANFGITKYQWSAMPTTNSKSAALAQLMYHWGVAVGMDYGTDYEGGSGAYVIASDNTVCAQTAFVKYFSYDPATIKGIRQRDYTLVNWTAMLKGELDAGRPVQYAGFDPGGGGHTWVCDGYDNAGFFHMNWGWGGSGNGYFSISNLSVAGYNFSTSAQMIIGIKPLGNVTPPTPPPTPVPPTPTPTNNCATPTGLSATKVDAKYVMFKWTSVPGATQYNVEHSQPLGTGSVTNSNDNSVDTFFKFNLAFLGTINPTTQYRFRVYAKCSSGNSTVSGYVYYTFPSDTVAPIPPPCTAPTSLSATSAATSAVLSWQGVVTDSFLLSVAGGTIKVKGLTSTITGLLPATAYPWQVKKICGTSFSAAPSASFTTSSIPCSAASGLVLNTTTLLTWQAVSGAISYNIKYVVGGVEKPATSSAPSLSVPGTVTSYQVQVVCANGTSNWVTQ